MTKTKRVALGISLLAVAAAAGVYVYADARPVDDIQTGPIATAVPKPASGDLNALPPPAAGAAEGKVDGTTVTGRVDRLYVRVAEGVLIELGRAPTTAGWRFASVEFPDPLVNGAVAARAIVPTGMVGDVNAGDVVEMRFANRSVSGPGFGGFRLLPERDQVVKIVGKANTDLARDYQRRILARSGADAQTGEAANPELWRTLPLEHAFKVVHGSGRREMAVFADPYCPACLAFEKELANVEDVTIHVFLMPVIRPEKSEVSRKLWCSQDRAQAWKDLVSSGKEPSASGDCANPIRENMALVQPVGIRATPTIVFPDGRRAQGALLASAVRENLDRVKSAQTASTRP